MGSPQNRRVLARQHFFLPVVSLSYCSLHAGVFQMSHTLRIPHSTAIARATVSGRTNVVHSREHPRFLLSQLTCIQPTSPFPARAFSSIGSALRVAIARARPHHDRVRQQSITSCQGATPRTGGCRHSSPPARDKERPMSHPLGPSRKSLEAPRVAAAPDNVNGSGAPFTATSAPWPSFPRALAF